MELLIAILIEALAQYCAEECLFDASSGARRALIQGQRLFQETLYLVCGDVGFMGRVQVRTHELKETGLRHGSRTPSLEALAIAFLHAMEHETQVQDALYRASAWFGYLPSQLAGAIGRISALSERFGLERAFIYEEAAALGEEPRDVIEHLHSVLIDEYPDLEPETHSAIFSWIAKRVGVRAFLD